RSPVKITFENGFRAFYNSKLHAVIGNCGQGVINAAAPKPVTNPPPTAGQVLDDKNKIERDEDDDD
ncbi:MAG TPA: hypothetical protein VJ508_04580, partial [Saprospiraceae bacterium]|nr:hypothetical protein [Saprospiraceae bacterium]